MVILAAACAVFVLMASVGLFSVLVAFPFRLCSARSQDLPGRTRGHRPPNANDPFIIIALGLALLQLVLFALASGGLLTSRVLLPVLVFAAATGWRLVLHSLRRFAAVMRRFLGASGFYEKALMLATAAALLLALVAAFAPPTETDALTIHAYLPKLYAEHGSMVYLGDHWDSTMAMGPHLLYAAMTALLTERAAETAPAILHFLVGALFVLWVWNFTRRLFGRLAAYSATAMLTVTPMMAHTLSAPMADTFFALSAFGAVVSILSLASSPTWRKVFDLSLLAAACAFSKYSGLAILAALFATGIIVAALNAKTFVKTSVYVAAAVALGVLLASPFYIRNYLWTGNPVFPAQKSLFHTAGWEKPSWQDASSGDERYGALHKSPANMLLAPWRVTTDAEISSGGISGAVSPALLCLLPVTFMLRSRKRVFLHLAIATVVTFVVVYWISPRPRSRYYLATLPLASMLAGASLIWLKHYSRPALLITKFTVLVGVAAGLAVAGLYSVSFAKVVFGIQTRDAFLSRTTDFHKTYRWMDEHLPADAAVLIEATNDFLYCPRRALRLGTSSNYTHCDSQDYFSLGADGSAEKAYARLGKLGVTHLFLHASFIERSTSPSGAILRQMLSSGALREVLRIEDTRGTRNPLSKRRMEEVVILELLRSTEGST